MEGLNHFSSLRFASSGESPGYSFMVLFTLAHAIGANTDRVGRVTFSIATRNHIAGAASGNN
jgi:hypothetical protein